MLTIAPKILFRCKAVSVHMRRAALLMDKTAIIKNMIIAAKKTESIITIKREL
jgi:hypothetical protein